MVKLINGDALVELDKLINQGIKVDAIITDPPYELDTHGGGNRKQWKNIQNNFISHISSGFNYEAIISKMDKISNNIIMFCSNKQISKLMSIFENKKFSTTLLVWHKENYVPFANGKHMSDIEFIIFARKKGAHFNNEMPVKLKSKVIKSKWRIKGKKKHPTQKSDEIMEHLIKLHSFKNDTILDPFMGSGSTGVIAKKLNRKFIGVELDKEYYEIAKERIEEVMNG